jgi:translation initiation factor IF-1
MSTKPSKAASRRLKMNAKGLEGALHGEIGDTHAFGRITKALGNSQMLVKLANGTEVKASIKGGLRSGGRGAPTRMGPGDIVVVALPDTSIASSVAIAHLIEAKITDRKDAVRLMKAGAIPEWMVLLADVSEVKAAKAEVEECYEFVADDDEDGGAAGGAGAGGRKTGGSKAKGLTAADDDISIADI